MAGFTQARASWHARAFEAGLALISLGKVAEGLLLGRQDITSGRLTLPRSILEPEVLDLLPPWLAPLLLILQALAAILVLRRLRVREAALALALLHIADASISFQNHRLVLILQWFFVALNPRPEEQPRGDVGWTTYAGLDLMRAQLLLIYLCAALHKMTPEFWSGDVLRSVFIQQAELQGVSTPGWLLDPWTCARLAELTVVGEVLLPLALLRRELAPWAILAAAVMHIAFSWYILYVWIFTGQMLLALLTCLPPAEGPPGRALLIPGPDGRRPRLLPALAWPGLVAVAGLRDPRLDGPRWSLMREDGAVLTGADAWIELLSRSPLTVLLAPALAQRGPRALLTRVLG